MPAIARWNMETEIEQAISEYKWKVSHTDHPRNKQAMVKPKV